MMLKRMHQANKGKGQLVDPGYVFKEWWKGGGGVKKGKPMNMNGQKKKMHKGYHYKHKKGGAKKKGNKKGAKWAFTFKGGKGMVAKGKGGNGGAVEMTEVLDVFE